MAFSDARANVAGGTLLLRGGRIIDPANGIDSIGDIVVANGVIRDVVLGANASGAAFDQVLDCAGLVIAPGFIDLHCHLRDPGLTHKESIASGTSAAAAGGFTTVCCMPNTDPVIDSQAVVDYVLRTARSDAYVRVLPIGAVTKGQDGKELAELGELAQAGAVAFSDDGRPVSTSVLMRHALEYSLITGRPVIDHCEDTALTKGAPANEGAVAGRLGLRGWPNAAEELTIARDIALAEATGGRLHIAHISTAGGVDLVRRAKARGLQVTAEATPHHLTLTDSWLEGKHLSWPAVGGEAIAPRTPYDTRTKVNPPLRTRQDVEAVIAGLADGVIDAIATDHAPHALVDKVCEFDQAAFGISGLETALPAVISLVAAGSLDLSTAIERLTSGPRRVLGALPADSPAGICSSGTLGQGEAADIVVFDPSATWVVDPGALRSKGKNTPLDGVTMTGKVRYTLVGGQVVFRG